jgi:hypothetical protein
VHPVIVEMTRYVSSITKGILGLLLLLLLDALSFPSSHFTLNLYNTPVSTPSPSHKLPTYTMSESSAPQAPAPLGQNRGIKFSFKTGNARYQCVLQDRSQ